MNHNNNERKKNYRNFIGVVDIPESNFIATRTTASLYHSLHFIEFKLIDSRLVYNAISRKLKHAFIEQTFLLPSGHFGNFFFAIFFFSLLVNLIKFDHFPSIK